MVSIATNCFCYALVKWLLPLCCDLYWPFFMAIGGFALGPKKTPWLKKRETSCEWLQSLSVFRVLINLWLKWPSFLAVALNDWAFLRSWERVEIFEPFEECSQCDIRITRKKKTPQKKHEANLSNICPVVWSSHSLVGAVGFSQPSR